MTVPTTDDALVNDLLLEQVQFLIALWELRAKLRLPIAEEDVTGCMCSSWAGDTPECPVHGKETANEPQLDG